MEKALISIIIAGWIIAFAGFIILYIAFRKKLKHSH